MTCPICNGARRIPWPEAGMMQDCECVRAARSLETAQRVVGLRIAGIAAADPWALPEGLTWRESESVGWFITDATYSQQLWLHSGRVRGLLSLRPDADALIDLLRRRNEQTT